MPQSYVPAGTARRKRAAPAPKPYHHGDLPQALLAAAEAVLVRDGIKGLGLRVIAREAGVSHTAPRHHFDDTTGLLSELAAVGYRRLAVAMMAALDASGADAQSRRQAIGRAYVHFAVKNPAMFRLMFSNSLIDMKRPHLSAAARDAMRTMAATIAGSAAAPQAPAAELPRADALRATAAWAYVHGLATLLIDQRLRGIVGASPSFKDASALVESVLDEVTLGLGIATP